ncbi:MAG: uncharacterized protein JWN04_4407 [Myxococcaceae bacterium]|nr:uncharacterized protein [Myxococcaceae bacterium]
MQANNLLMRHTVKYERRENARSGARIECIWHEHMPAYIASYLPPRAGRHYVWMNHPAWYMRPVHVLLAQNGVEELVLGSSGHGGRAALEALVCRLARGASTLLAVDGPAGPAHRLKRGAVDLALRTGLPLVAIRFTYERALRSFGWDRKNWPTPGSCVHVTESEPLYVTQNAYQAGHDALVSALGPA